MKDIIVIFIIVVMSYLLFKMIFGDNKEHLMVGYNSINIPENKISTLFDIENDELSKILKTSFKDNIDSIGFKNHNPHIFSPFNEPIKRFIIDYLKNNIERFKKDKLQIVSDINNLFYKDDGNDRIFIFNVSIINNTRFMTINLKVKIKVKDIKNFIQTDIDSDIMKISELTNYKTNIPVNNMLNAMELLSMRLENNIYKTFQFNGIDILEPQFYEIKNILGLMEPFLTSRKDMMITKQIKQQFIKDT